MAGGEIEEALSLKRAGELDRAAIALEGVLASRPQHVLALTHLAEVQARRGRRAEAWQCLDRAEAVAGMTARTAELRGDLHYKEGRYAAAARSYEDAEALGAKGTWSLVQLARCRLRQKDLEGAKGAAAKAVERDPSSSGGWLVLGDIAKKEARGDDAIEMYQRAHEAAPKDTFVYARLVEARLEKLPPDEKKREIEVLLKTTGNAHLRGVLAKLHKDEGDMDQAAQEWAKASGTKGNAFSRRMYAFSLLKAGKDEEAAAALARSLADDPANVIVFRNYVNLQKKRGAVEELRRTLEELLPRAGARAGVFKGELKRLLS
jgi:tetratricopeptide (TPR) repeat protein